jgi:SAM-dependent methyltransferase
LNFWNERYGAARYYYGTGPNDFLREHCNAIRAGGEVLCLGEGEGRNAVYLAEQGFRVVAVDQSEVGLRKAEQLATDRHVRIETVVADLDGYRIDRERWDGIVSIWCHLPATLRAAVHGQVVAGLKVGGVFLLEAYTPAQLAYGTGGPRTADLLPTLAGLRQELPALDLVHAQELERVVNEGEGHTGPSAVVQVVARRR